MALDVYFRQDISNILRSINLAGGGTAAIVHQAIERAVRQGQPIETADLADDLDLYQQGYRDALGAVATAFGILPGPASDVVPDVLIEQTNQTRSDRQYMAAAWQLNRETPV